MRVWQRVLCSLQHLCKNFAPHVGCCICKVRLLTEFTPSSNSCQGMYPAAIALMACTHIADALVSTCCICKSHDTAKSLRKPKRAAAVKVSRLTVAELHSGLVCMHVQHGAGDESAGSGALARGASALLLPGCRAGHWHVHQQSATWEQAASSV